MCHSPLRYHEQVRKVEVQIPSNPYTATIEPGLLARAGELLRETLPDRSHYLVITVPPVRKAWADTLTTSLTNSKLMYSLIEMPDGERAKKFDTVRELATKLVRRGADRLSVVIALGGGVVGDVAAFLASIYMRGIDVVQIPTTFLAQVDAAIGGKTGVDLPEGKNLLGTFHQPRAVLIDPRVLSTLPERDYRSGLYEAMKCGIIRRADIFEFMEQNRERILQRDPAALEWLIAECVQVKAEVVVADERESGLRRILNFGHTVGHALEAETGYKQFLHGEAVAWGMIAASMISAAMQMSNSETARRIISSVLAYAPLPKVESRGKRIARRLANDKKTVNGIAHFVLPVELGKVEIVPDVPERAVIQAVEELRYLSQA
jgi:3-dehydroquinate synthase